LSSRFITLALIAATQSRMAVYLDHVFQHNVMFATAQDAVLWLTLRIDQGVPGRLN
jgi:hypothetical protein